MPTPTPIRLLVAYKMKVLEGFSCLRLLRHPAPYDSAGIPPNSRQFAVRLLFTTPMKMSHSTAGRRDGFVCRCMQEFSLGSVASSSNSNEAVGSLRQPKFNHAPVSTSSNHHLDKMRASEEERVSRAKGLNSKIPLTGSSYDENFPPLNISGSSSKDKRSGKRRNRVDLGLEKNVGDAESSELERYRSTNLVSQSAESLPPGSSGRSCIFGHLIGSSSSHRNHAKSVGVSKSLSPRQGMAKFVPFDICQSKRLSGNRGKFKWVKKTVVLEENKQIIEGGRHEVLRSGMVLLKHYLSLDEQSNVVSNCRELGVNPVGFYQPGYSDGAKLRLRMMCLGKNWDPETKYACRHPDKKPPDLPPRFINLVQRAIQDAHALLRNNSGLTDVENVLPALSPDVCIVNFYTSSGRLGVHQDRDESSSSIEKGLPVVSFSIGDSAEFLYGDCRNVKKAKKVVLESGDVLIFGGESRLVYHGVSSIVPNSAPKSLLYKTGLRPGRLNLTFRQH